MAPKPTKTVPTPQELEILKVIWQRGHATVREVYNDLSKNRKIAYTTVLTMMGILEHKGHLKKTAGERAYVFTHVQPQAAVMDEAAFKGNVALVKTDIFWDSDAEAVFK